jgi:putative membrane-bound dehydrogenase-like protein
MRRFIRSVSISTLVFFACTAVAWSVADNPDQPASIRVLFLGDKGHHQPAARFKQIQPVLASRGIELTYSDRVADLSAKTLAAYDGLVVYANHTTMSAEQEAALVEFVEGGKGFVPLHCASACFGSSAKYVALVGGRFAKHGFGKFRARIIDAQHPAMRGLGGFEATDEDYTHSDVAADIQALMVRDEAGGYEPSCWVRRQGKGRVFYTALGHDEKTFGQPEFHKLVENGIRWATGRLNDDLPPLEYVDAGAPIPNYTAGQKWGTQGKNLNRIAKPLPPEQSIKHMHMPEGFRAELFAAEPDIKKPMAGSWDERGRLWIIESVDYPNKLLDDPHKNGNDQIKICEDTDGDGRADKFTVFANKLNIPTAIVNTNGGVVVACAPHLLFLKDTDGDDRADVREIILTGFGRGDTHAVTSNLRYGLDNWIWGTCGYSGGKVKVGDTEHNFRQCIFRFKLESTVASRTEGTKGTGRTEKAVQQSAISNQQSPSSPTPTVSSFEVITPTSNNTWGLGFSETGDVFCSTANNQHLVHMAIPNRYFEMVRGWHGVGSAGIEDHKRLHPIVADFRQMDWHGGFTAAAGCEVYTARSFPPEYWNRAVFVCEPTARLVHIDWLVANGSGFIAKDGWNLVASTDPWFGPVDAKVGPDGAVWILDWYNYIIQHNPTPAGFKTGRGNAYETPLRDQTHGRIYRVVYDGPKPSGLRERVAGVESSRPQAAGHTLIDEKAGGSKTRPQSPVRFDRATPAELIGAFSDKNMWVRLTAQRLLVEGKRTELAPQLHETFMKYVRDKSGQQADGLPTAIELAALHARQTEESFAETPRLAGMLLPPQPNRYMAGQQKERLAMLLFGANSEPSVVTGENAARFLSESTSASDPWIPLAAVIAGAKSDVNFLSAAALNLKSDAASAKRVTDAVRVVAENFARRKPDNADLGVVIRSLNTSDVPVISDAAVAGLAAGWPAEYKPKLDEEANDALEELVVKLSAQGQLALAKLAGRMGIQGKFDAAVAGIRNTMLARLADASLADEARVAAARQLISVGTDNESMKSLLDLVTPAASPALSGGIIEALGDSGSEEVGVAIIARWSSLTPTTRRAALAVLVKRPAWTRALLDAIEAGKVDSTDLASDQATTLAGHPDRAIAERAKTVLARKGRLPDPNRQKVMDEFEPITKETGDVAAGKAAFTKHCAKCHTHSGEGSKVGPDLTGMAVHPKIELLTNILDPSRSVEGNYRAYLVATKDGRVLTGLLASETKTALELFDTEGKKQVVLREDVEELLESAKSLMPEGFEKQLTREELTNLLEFLAARGKYLPLDLRRVATVVSTRGMFISEDSDVERLIFRDWSPKTFDGVPFVLVDPQGDRVKNAILLHGPQGTLPPKMPKSVTLPCNAPARAIHLLSGVGGWAFPFDRDETVSMIVRLHYADGATEDHELKNGVHFADYIRVVDVPESKLAFRLRGQQIRYLAVQPKRTETIASIELVKGPDSTAPVVMAVTLEDSE